MKAIDFINQNKDVLIAPFTEAEFNDLTEGRVLFCVTVAAGAIDANQRQVRNVGYHMVVATNRDAEGNLEDVITLALTQGGYAKCETITKADILSMCAVGCGTKLVYHCVPLSLGDPRRSHHWLPDRG